MVFTPQIGDHVVYMLSDSYERPGQIRPAFITNYGEGDRYELMVFTADGDIARINQSSERWPIVRAYGFYRPFSLLQNGTFSYPVSHEPITNNYTINTGVDLSQNDTFTNPTVSRLDLVRAGKSDILDIKDDAATREQIIDLLMQLQRLKGAGPSPRNRHIQICITQLEGILANFAMYVEGQP